MARRIKQYDSLSPVLRKQILKDLKYNAISLLDVDINQSKKKAVLVNSQDEEWLVILNFSPEVEEDDDDENDNYSDDYSDDEGSSSSFDDDFDNDEE